MKSKILIVLSLLVIAALAVPLGLMTAAILRGESPRQLAEKEQLAEGRLSFESSLSTVPTGEWDLNFPMN